MKVTVHFSKLIQNFTHKEQIEISVDSYRDIISAFINLFPDVKKNFITKQLHKQITLIDDTHYVRNFELDFIPKTGKIYIIPTISGGISNSFDSLGNLSLFYGSSTVLSSQSVELRGIDKRIRDSSLFGKGSVAFDVAQRKSNRDNGLLDNADDPSRGFGSLGTMSAPGTNIPLHFGLVRTSGVLINQYIKHIQRGGIDTVRVSDYL
jgi:predicted phage tail protein